MDSAAHKGIQPGDCGGRQGNLALRPIRFYRQSKGPVPNRPLIVNGIAPNLTDIAAQGRCGRYN
jgi:hypothetical protein